MVKPDETATDRTIDPTDSNAELCALVNHLVDDLPPDFSWQLDSNAIEDGLVDWSRELTLLFAIGDETKNWDTSKEYHELFGNESLGISNGHNEVNWSAVFEQLFQ